MHNFDVLLKPRCYTDMQAASETLQSDPALRRQLR